MGSANPKASGLFSTSLEAKAVGDESPESRVVRFVASDESIDSHGDIVEQDWDFARFDKNPVVLYHHNKATDSFLGGSLQLEETFPVGRAVDRGVGFDQEIGKHLWIDVEFAPSDLNEFADKVFRNVKAGFIKGGSVGFRPHSVVVETINDVDVYRLRQNELYEFSIVPMGSCMNAVSLSADDEAAHVTLLKSLAKRSQPEIQAEPLTMPDPQTPVENAAVVPVQAGADVDKLKALEVETSSLREKLAKRDAADADRDVDALIGKKIVPANRADFLELRTLNADLFARITNSIPYTGLEKTVVQPAPIEEHAPQDAESAQKTAARLLRPSKES
jgi:hypothetical protein